MFDINEAVACVLPDPVETLKADACGWPVSQRKRLLTMLEDFPGLGAAEKARKLRLAANNFAVWLETAFLGEDDPRGREALAAMERDGVKAVDLRIAIDDCTRAAMALEGR